MIFWTFFELAGSALTVFTDNNVKKTGFLTTTMFQSLNPLFIMLFAPVFSWIWINLSKRNIEPAAPIKFGIALLLLGAGFWVLNLGSGSAQAGMIPAIFMILLYLLHTLGELALSPVGLSLVTKLSPAKVVGFVMGFWLMSSSFAHLAGGKIAKMTDVNMATMLHETERLNRFNENLADEKIKAAWVNNKEFYAMYVGKNASEEAIKKYEAVHKGDSNLIKLCKKGHSVQSYITSKYFLDELNKGLEAPAYFVGQVADAEMMAAAVKTDNEVYKQKLMDEGVQSFLTTDASYVVAEGQKPKELKAEDIKELIAKSPNGMINEAVAKDTLVICLGVFAQLGMFAMGAGLFLILLSPIINRWMHGIK
jgi:POT family proton-dependent oligopeptide transporter